MEVIGMIILSIIGLYTGAQTLTYFWLKGKFGSAFEKQILLPMITSVACWYAVFSHLSISLI